MNTLRERITAVFGRHQEDNGGNDRRHLDAGMDWEYLAQVILVALMILLALWMLWKLVKWMRSSGRRKSSSPRRMDDNYGYNVQGY